MRITNKIMQRNNLSNINTNKVYQDKLSTQMSTQKKVNRPSDDPVVSIRALRLRSNVTEVTQYYSKNIPDAESWLDVTEDALKNLTEIITSMIKQSTKGSNGDLKAEDRQIILEQLKALGDEVYSTGDADYAGRYVFTGYRTDTSLSFDKEYNTEYNITEQLGNSSITKLTKVNTGKLLDITAANYKDAGFDKISEQDVKATEVYRIQLSYNDCKKNGTPSISFQEKQADGSYQPKMKCSDSASKAIIPGKKMPWRLYDENGQAQCDLIAMDGEEIEAGKPVTMVNLDSDAIERTVTITPTKVKKLLVPHILNGELAIELPSIAEKKAYIAKQLTDETWESELRLECPHKHYVNMTPAVAECRSRMYAELHGGKV